MNSNFSLRYKRRIHVETYLNQALSISYFVSIIHSKSHCWDCRRNYVSKLENVVLENLEIDCLNYEEKLLSSHNTEKNFKHLNYLNKANCIPKVTYKGHEASCSDNETARFFNEFFLSVYSPKIAYTLPDIRNKRSVLTIFDVSRSKIPSILTDLDITKSRGPNKFLPGLFTKTAVQMSTNLNKIRLKGYENFKNFGKMLLSCLATRKASNN